MAVPLKLRAGDAEDIAVISACLQDALISFPEAQFFPADKRFVLVASRFRWENCADSVAGEGDQQRTAEPCTCYERVRTVLCFDAVTGVRLSDMQSPKELNVMELLAVTVEDAPSGEGGEDGQTVVLFFAGGGTIRLEVGQILCHLEDLGDPWPTMWRPQHSTETDD